MALTIVEARQQRQFTSVDELAAYCQLDREELTALAAADALKGLAGHRHSAHWQVAGIEKSMPLLAKPRFNEAQPLLQAPSEQRQIFLDYETTAHSLRDHPMSLIRQELAQLSAETAKALWGYDNNQVATVAGIVVGRQSPGTASGVMFITLEDETGVANIIVWPKVIERFRSVLLTSKVLLVKGKLQQAEGVLHLISETVIDLSSLLSGIQTKSRDFH